MAESLHQNWRREKQDIRAGLTLNAAAV